MTTIVVYDANVLYPNTVRDLLIRLAQTGLVAGRWTERILSEMATAVAANRPDIPAAKLTVLRKRMNGAVRDCLVIGYEPLIDALKLPDPNDRHVLAAAIKCGAELIVTFNMKDFPADALAEWGIEALNPDDFLLDLIDLDARVVWACIQQIVDSRHKPPESIEDVLSQLERSGLIGTVAALRTA